MRKAEERLFLHSLNLCLCEQLRADHASGSVLVSMKPHTPRRRSGNKEVEAAIEPLLDELRPVGVASLLGGAGRVPVDLEVQLGGGVGVAGRHPARDLEP